MRKGVADIALRAKVSQGGGDIEAEKRFMFRDLDEPAPLLTQIKEAGENGSHVYNDLLGAFDEKICNLNQLYIAPDSSLNLISFADLRLQNGRFLAERQTIGRSKAAGICSPKAMSGRAIFWWLWAAWITVPVPRKPRQPSRENNRWRRWPTPTCARPANSKAWLLLSTA